MRLSIILITKNEEHNIQSCLESVVFADEIIIIDNQSTDKTVEIAKKFGAKIIITNDWPGFGIQKTRALNLATGNWILSIDADERVTKALQSEIVSIINANNSLDGYYISRLSWYCGKFIKYSGWRPDYVLRLFKREKANFTKHIVHERIQMHSNQKLGYLHHHFLHYSYLNIDQILEKMNRYSSAGADQAFSRGVKISVFGAFLKGLWAFFRTYIFRLGFLDGSHGFVLASAIAHETYYRYLKIWELVNKKKKYSDKKIKF